MSQPALLGGEKTRQQPYPDWPVWDQREIDALAEVVRSGQWGGFPFPGPKTRQLAQQFCELQGADYAVPMMNGTVTMEVALRAADIGWSDEVIVPAYTFHATASAPMAAGAIPVIVDIDPANYCIDPKAIEKAITPRTRAIIPVHLASNMADMDAIMAIANAHNLVVIEDAAHAHGAYWRGKGAGTLGHFGSFSLQASKTLSSGEGGILLCQDAAMAARAAAIIDCGRPHALGGGSEDDAMPYQMGVNYRMTELAAALAVVGLERFPDQFKQREAMADLMDEALSEVPGVRVFKRDPRLTRRSVFMYTFAIDPPAFGMNHHLLCTALDAEGIACWQGYEPMHRYPLFQPQKSRLPVPSAFPHYFDFADMHLPEGTRAYEQEAVWLFEGVFRCGESGVDEVITALRKIQSHAPELRQKAGK
jgi:dTDP-4-amino-4,6-dideoxygalactose transaminase